jgi:hypothetical protein
MASREPTVETPTPKRALRKKEIRELFEKLDLGTAADRDRFLRLQQLVHQPDSNQDCPGEALRVFFSHSTEPRSDSR